MHRRWGKPSFNNSVIKKLTLPQVYENYRSAVALLSKIGFNAQQVWDMSHAEINAWIESYLIQHGVKKKSLRSDETVTSYVFRRRKSQEKKGA